MYELPYACTRVWLCVGADELKFTNGKLAKLLNAAKKNVNDGDPSEQKIVDTIKDAIDVSKKAEQVHMHIQIPSHRSL